MAKREATIVLLTDFGNKDGYSGIMKGVIRALHPRASIIDLSHEIEPQNIREAAFVLWQSHKYFPKGSIFVVVVDPGVGTKRKIVCLKSREYLFLAPDNGVLEYLLSERRSFIAVEVVNEQLFLKNVSTTFHGRDIFAPVAAALADGLDLRKLGPPLRVGSRQKPFIELDLSKSADHVGSVIYVDRFGNVITNFRVRGSIRRGGRISLQIHKTTVSRFRVSFGDTGDGKPFCYADSSGLLAVAITKGNAAASLGARIGSTVRLKVSR
ncbi:MAG: S-adenosyl-l-methionine hydroxide adenosyltransferase family protein [Bacteroidota bacterium]